ncbi:MAG: GNAT family N-acetyltransferase [Roseburia sp.]|nr:GNAT family N-acetyltransferase [Roseburia sp.]
MRVKDEEINLTNIDYKWTDGTNKTFQKFYLITENYYSKIVGGVENRKSFIPYNISESIQEALIAYIGDVPVACSGLKKYSEKDVEIKRVWVEPEHRGHHIATSMMKMIETKAKQQGFQRTILQTREIMKDAVKLYVKLGYYRIDNYPPYNELDGAICFAKDLN